MLQKDLFGTPHSLLNVPCINFLAEHAMDQSQRSTEPSSEWGGVQYDLSQKYDRRPHDQHVVSLARCPGVDARFEPNHILHRIIRLTASVERTSWFIVGYVASCAGAFFKQRSEGKPTSFVSVHSCFRYSASWKPMSLSKPPKRYGDGNDELWPLLIHLSKYICHFWCLFNLATALLQYQVPW